jgi:hypothetical protein
MRGTSIAIIRVTAAVFMGALLITAGAATTGDTVAGSPTTYVIEPPFNSQYTLTKLGSVPGVPVDLGGIAFPPGYLDVLVVGGNANDSDGVLSSVVVTRDGQRRIVGFEAVPSPLVSAPYIDGGVAYGPEAVLFYARYQDTTAEIGEIKPGSAATDRVAVLDGFGVAEAPGGLGFVPHGFPGAGRLKMTSYEDGAWYDLGLTPSDDGTFDVISADLMTNVTPGSDGFVFVPPGMPEFDDYSVLVNEYDDNMIAAYEIDSNGDPIPATRRPFAAGLDGPLGAAFDPVTGDLLVSEYGSDEVFVISGFTPARGDINCDGVVDARDSLALLVSVAEAYAELPPGCPMLVLG